VSTEQLTKLAKAVQGKTEVIVDEARSMVSYILDENLIDFGSALEEQDYDRCVTNLFCCLLLIAGICHPDMLAGMA